MSDPLPLPDEGNGPYRVMRAFAADAVEDLRRGCEDPEGIQRARLRALLEGAAGTAFAADHGLDGAEALEGWRSKVPIRDFDALRPWMDRAARGEARVLTWAPLTQLLKTSGTTGAAKLLPVTEPYARAVDRGQALWRLGLIRDREAITKGAALTVVSPAIEGRTAEGMPFGSNTGRMQARQPWIVRLRYPVPRAVFAIPDAEARTYAVLRFALQARVSSITTANPSTILLLCRRLQAWREDLSGDLRDGTLERGPGARIDPALRRRLRWTLKRRTPPSGWRPAEIWDLACLNCWTGGPAPFFLRQLPEAVGAELPVRDVGITASEGYFAIPLADGEVGGLAWLGGHLLEFVGEDGAPRWAWELETGARYRLVISTAAGLYRYDIGDILEVVGWRGRAPVLRFVRRAGDVLNVTGEKVTGDQIVAAARAALQEVGAAIGAGGVVGFTAAHALRAVPAIQLAVEGLPPEIPPPRLAVAFDAALRRANVEYDSKRDNGRLAPAEVLLLPRGSYARYRADRVAAGAPDGQVKDPIVARDEVTWRALVEP